MEVHHHSHHPKKWKEYVTEFLMLFLAVSMGFVAENLREKHVENERAEELIHALIIDVKENQKQLLEEKNSSTNQDRKSTTTNIFDLFRTAKSFMRKKKRSYFY